MPNRETIVAAIETHCRTLTASDKAGWLRIWADEAVLEDPVGVDTFRGIDALGSTFWPLVELTSPMRLELQDAVIVCGNEAIAVLAAQASAQGVTRNVGPLVDHFTFGPDGKIVSMRAHWNFATHGYRPEMATDPARREAMIAAIAAHCRAESEGDAETWFKLFADDIFIEDPVGSGNIHQGIDALRTGFWPQAQAARPRVEQTAAPIVSGNEAIAFIKAEIGPAEARLKIDPIVAHFVFDAAGKVKRLRAFFEY